MPIEMYLNEALKYNYTFFFICGKRFYKSDFGITYY